MHIFRKHKRALLITMFLFIGLPMLFFGVPAFWGNGQNMPGTAVVASVGGIPVVESDFITRLGQVAQQQAGGGERPSYQELWTSGVAADVLQEFTDRALIQLESRKRNFTVEDSLLIDQFKKDPYFLDDEENFVPERWNAWVRANEKGGTSWKALYADMNRELEQQLYLGLMMAPSGRVFDSDIDEELTARYTKLQLKYASIEPAVEPSEVEIQQEFETNKERYKNPDRRQAEYVAISLDAPPSEKVAEALEKARQSNDFAALANEMSEMGVDDGGDMGWVTQPEDPADPVSALFGLSPGQVSEPVAGAGGYFIYKNEEERMTTPEGEGVEPEQEIHGRRIFIATRLEAEERTALGEKAQSLLESARESGDLAAAASAAAASAAGLAVASTPWFQRGDTALAGLPSTDVFSFIQALNIVEAGGFSEVVQSPRNLYVAKVVGFEEGTYPTLEEVRDRVRENAINTLKRGEAYQKRVADLAEVIMEKATSLEQAKELYPDLDLQIAETSEFSAKETSYVQPMFIPAVQLYQLFEEKEAGAVAGPVSSFIGETYLFELVKKTPPSEEDQAKWPEERDEIRDNLARLSENAYFHDFRLKLREKLDPDTPDGYPSQLNDEVLFRVLGLDEPSVPEVDLSVEMPTVSEPDAGTQSSGDISLAPDTPTEASSEADTPEPATAPAVSSEPGAVNE